MKDWKRTEIEQLLSYCEHREREMWYYGNREYFEKRHESIKEKLNEMLKSAK